MILKSPLEVKQKIPVAFHGTGYTGTAPVPGWQNDPVGEPEHSHLPLTVGTGQESIAGGLQNAPVKQPVTRLRPRSGTGGCYEVEARRCFGVKYPGKAGGPAIRVTASAELADFVDAVCERDAQLKIAIDRSIARRNNIVTNDRDQVVENNYFNHLEALSRAHG